MLFSSAIFLFLFLPLALALVVLAPKSWRNGILLACSLFFYTWGEGWYIVLLLSSISVNYFIGIYIQRQAHVAQRWLWIGVVFNLSLLCFYKYFGFLGQNASVLIPFLKQYQWFYKNIHLPLGISFFTFQSLSYIIDVYRKNTAPQKNFVNYALLIALFPHQIAGPIIRYKDIADQLTERKITPDSFALGIERFIIGLGKKMLLANTLAYVADAVFASPMSQLSTSLCWFGAICYSLQLYYDFSGYSDMAIGLGAMVGFHFLENFNFPYIAHSIQDFWRRWHISLSSWFRDYVYIPLGGNREGKFRTYFNLLIVFFLTGLWHGASWTFIVWGLFHGFFILMERLFLQTLLTKSWKPFQHIYALLVVVVGWVLFRADNFEFAAGFVGKMFLYQSSRGSTSELWYLMDHETILVLGLALVLVVPWKAILMPKFEIAFAKFATVRLAHKILTILFLCSVFYLSVLYLTANTYNPFIYFRF